MLPQHLVVKFWSDVKDQLRKEHNIDEARAQQYIDVYCDRMRQHGGLDMVYHENPADVARGLSHGGILVPEPTTEERRSELVKNFPQLEDVLAESNDK